MERQLSVTPAKKVVVELSTLCSSLREGGCNPIPHTRSKHAAPVYGWFTEGFDTADLKEAKRLLDELA